jgi:hypothetical protein
MIILQTIPENIYFFFVYGLFLPHGFSRRKISREIYEYLKISGITAAGARKPVRTRSGGKIVSA